MILKMPLLEQQPHIMLRKDIFILNQIMLRLGK